MSNIAMSAEEGGKAADGVRRKLQAVMEVKNLARNRKANRQTEMEERAGRQAAAEEQRRVDAELARKDREERALKEAATLRKKADEALAEANRLQELTEQNRVDWKSLRQVNDQLTIALQEQVWQVNRAVKERDGLLEELHVVRDELEASKAARLEEEMLGLEVWNEGLAAGIGRGKSNADIRLNGISVQSHFEEASRKPNGLGILMASPLFVEEDLESAFGSNPRPLSGLASVTQSGRSPVLVRPPNLHGWREAAPVCATASAAEGSGESLTTSAQSRSPKQPDSSKVKGSPGNSGTLGALFEFLDRDKSGVVSFDELGALTAVWQEKGRGMDVDHLRKIFAFVDADDDGSITRVEWNKRVDMWLASHSEDEGLFLSLPPLKTERIDAQLQEVKALVTRAKEWDDVYSDGPSEDRRFNDSEIVRSSRLILKGERLELHHEKKWYACEVLKVKEDRAFPNYIHFLRGDFKNMWCLIDIVRSRVEAPLWIQPKPPFRFLHAEEEFSIDDVIELLQVRGQTQRLRTAQLIGLISRARRIVSEEPALLHISPANHAGVTILGDIHGNFDALISLTRLAGTPNSSESLLCLGDYVDRGKDSIKTLAMLLSWKVKFPEKVFLLRGNHEDANINCRYGFLNECLEYCSDDSGLAIYRHFNNLFSYLPVAALVGPVGKPQVFCCHGGLGPNSDSLEAISSLDQWRPLALNLKPRSGWEKTIVDLLWADPIKDGDVVAVDSDGFARNASRGLSSYWASNATERFLQHSGLKMIIRGHEVAPYGIMFSHNQQVLTLFSCNDYQYGRGNSGAALKFKQDVENMQFWQLHSDGGNGTGRLDKNDPTKRLAD